jgi:hypothetical protein
MEIKIILGIISFTILIFLLVRFYRLGNKYRSKCKESFKSKYGYDIKKTFDPNYIRFLFNFDDKLIKKYWVDWILNLVLFAVFIVLTTYLFNS